PGAGPGCAPRPATGPTSTRRPSARPPARSATARAGWPGRPTGAPSRRSCNGPGCGPPRPHHRAADRQPPAPDRSTPPAAPAAHPGPAAPGALRQPDRTAAAPPPAARTARRNATNHPLRLHAATAARTGSSRHRPPRIPATHRPYPAQPPPEPPARDPARPHAQRREIPPLPAPPDYAAAASPRAPTVTTVRGIETLTRWPTSPVYAEMPPNGL